MVDRSGVQAGDLAPSAGNSVGEKGERICAVCIIILVVTIEIDTVGLARKNKARDAVGKCQQSQPSEPQGVRRPPVCGCPTRASHLPLPPFLLVPLGQCLPSICKSCFQKLLSLHVDVDQFYILTNIPGNCDFLGSFREASVGLCRFFSCVYIHQPCRQFTCLRYLLRQNLSCSHQLQ